jgi:hypothetical protein
MKNKLTVLVLLLLVSFTKVKAQAQIISLGLDPELAMFGAYDYEDNPVLHLHFSWASRISLKEELGIKVSFANLKYSYFSYGFIYNRKLNLINLSENCNRSLDVVETLVGAKLGIIQRNYPEFKTQKIYFDPQLNAQIRWWITDSVGIYSKVNFSPRRDLNYYGSHQSIHYEVEVGLITNF